MYDVAWLGGIALFIWLAGSTVLLVARFTIHRLWR